MDKSVFEIFFHLLNPLGLIFSVVGSYKLVILNLKKTRNIDDELIVYYDEHGDYTQKKHLKEWVNSINGSTFILMGFIFQLIPALVNSLSSQNLNYLVKLLISK